MSQASLAALPSSGAASTKAAAPLLCPQSVNSSASSVAAATTAAQAALLRLDLPCKTAKSVPSKKVTLPQRQHPLAFAVLSYDHYNHQQQPSDARSMLSCRKANSHHQQFLLPAANSRTLADLPSHGAPPSKNIQSDYIDIPRLPKVAAVVWPFCEATTGVKMKKPSLAVLPVTAADSRSSDCSSDTICGGAQLPHAERTLVKHPQQQHRVTDPIASSSSLCVTLTACRPVGSHSISFSLSAADVAATANSSTFAVTALSRRTTAAACSAAATSSSSTTINTLGSSCRQQHYSVTSPSKRYSLFRVPLLLLLALWASLGEQQQTMQPATAQLKFAGLGNWGFEGGNQQKVADTLKKVARAEHISFLVSPGSNFAGGVSSLKDPKWEKLFEDVYGAPDGSLKMLMFTVLGSEDWSGDYNAEALRTELSYSPTSDVTGEKTAVEIAAVTTDEDANSSQEELTRIAQDAAAAAKERDKSKNNFPKWTLPNWWYHTLMHFPATNGNAFIGSGHKDMSVGLVFIDTWVLSSSFPYSTITKQAWEDLEKTLSLAPKIFDFIVVVADRSIYSSGSSKGDTMLQYYLLPLLEKADIDLMISGYDFSQEVLTHNNITYANCGAGSYGVGSSMVKNSGSLYYSPEAGFCLFELSAEGITTRLINGLTGENLYTYKQALKKRPDRQSIDSFKYVSQLPEVNYWAIPSMGKLPGRDIFVRVVGTLGLCIATFFASLSLASAVSRYMK